MYVMGFRMTGYDMLTQHLPENVDKVCSSCKGNMYPYESHEQKKMPENPVTQWILVQPSRFYYSRVIDSLHLE